MIVNATSRRKRLTTAFLRLRPTSSGTMAKAADISPSKEKKEPKKRKLVLQIEY